MRASWTKYILQLKTPGGTSRGVLTTKPSWFIRLEEKDKICWGECGLLPALSADDRPGYEAKLDEVVTALNRSEEIPDLTAWPSIRFGLEMALRDLETAEPFLHYPSTFTSGQKGIHINGLVWMGTPAEMQNQIDAKITDGYTCIKLKIGAIDFDEEIRLLKSIRHNFSAGEITIRVDANGAFSPEEAPGKLERLAALNIHSIEQPIKAGLWDAMAQLCADSPIPIALDEELIGITSAADQRKLMESIRPQAIILKPSFLGGFQATDEWIALAAEFGVDWWITSALESNIGLNAIAQYTFTKQNPLPQGLGTGQLYTNNFASPLEISNGKLFHRGEKNWDISNLS